MSLIEEAAGYRGHTLAVGERLGDDVRIVFARFLERGESREDLGREYLEVYHAQDEAVPRIRRLPHGQLVHTPELYTEDERKASQTYNEFYARSKARYSAHPAEVRQSISRRQRSAARCRKTPHRTCLWIDIARTIVQSSVIMYECARR